MIIAFIFVYRMHDKFQISGFLFLLIARAESGHQKIGSSGNTATAEVFTASAKPADTPASSTQLSSHPPSSVKGTTRGVVRQFGWKICY